MILRKALEFTFIEIIGITVVMGIAEKVGQNIADMAFDYIFPSPPDNPPQFNIMMPGTKQPRQKKGKA